MYPQLNVIIDKYEKAGGIISGTYSGTLKNAVSMVSVNVSGAFSVTRMMDMK